MQAEEAAVQSGDLSSVPASPDVEPSRVRIESPSPGPPEDAAAGANAAAGPDAAAGADEAEPGNADTQPLATGSASPVPPPPAKSPSPVPATVESSLASAYSGVLPPPLEGPNQAGGGAGTFAHVLINDDGRESPAVVPTEPLQGGGDGHNASAGTGVLDHGAAHGSFSGTSAVGELAFAGAGTPAAAANSETPRLSPMERFASSHDPATSLSGAAVASGARGSAAGSSRDGSAHGSWPTDAGPSRPRSREAAGGVPPVPVAAAARSLTGSAGSARTSLASPPLSSRLGPHAVEPFTATVVGHNPAAHQPRTPREAVDVIGGILGHGGAPPAAAHPPLAAAVPPPPPQHAHEERVGSAGSIAAGNPSAMAAAAAPLPHSGPLVRPFAERGSRPPSGADARPGSPPQGPLSGRRPGSHGSVRHGSAHNTPLPGSPATGATGLGSPKMSRASTVGARSATTDGAAASHQAAAGTPGTGSTPPQPQPRVNSRDRDGKPRAAHAAGGGAAAVKAAAAAAAGKAGPSSDLSHDQQLQQQLMLGEAIKITGVTRSGVSRSSLLPGGGAAGVPGRRGRRPHARSAAAVASAAATAAYFAELEAEIAAGNAGGTALLPSGLARRLKAARMMATGPPPFQRRREPPPPPSPAGVKLDGFMLLEAADEEMPEAVQAAFLESHSIGSVESADLAYFIALRDLDISDNRLPDMACLAPLQALVRLRAASCRLTTLGRWHDGGAGGGGGGGGDAAERPAAGTDDGAAGRKSFASRSTSTGVAATAAAAAVAAVDGAAAPPPDGGQAAAGGADASAPAASAEFSESLLLPPLPLVLNPFQRLELLDLSFNSLPPSVVLLPGCPLALLPRLAELDLSSNRLRHLPSPAEIAAAAAEAEAEAAAVRSSADSTAAAGAAGAGRGGGVAFPALRRLRLANNGLKSGALASLAALSPPQLTHLDLSHNAIAEAPPHLLHRISPTAAAAAGGAAAGGGQPPLPRLELLDLTFNKVAAEAAVAPLTQLPALRRLLLAGNPLVATAHRPHGGAAGSPLSSKLDLSLEGPPARPSVASSLTARFARIAEAPPKQQASNLAAAAAAAITAAAAPERVTEAFDRMDATIEQWRLNTVMEEDEEEEEEDEDDGEEPPEDRTFLTGVGIQERRRRGGRPGSGEPAGSDDAAPEAAPEAPREPTPEPAPSEGSRAGEAADGGVAAAPPQEEERPLWESITDPTERLAVALGLDPLTLPMHTGALTTDSAGAIAALRFALAHPLVEADDGLAPAPHYAATTTATQLKRKPRRAAAPPQRLAPLEAAAAAAAAAAGGGAAGPRAAKIQTVEAMLDGMKGKLAALEASLAAQLAAAPTAPPPEAVRNAVRASKGRYGVQRGGGGARGPTGSDTDSETVEDGASTGSGLPDDVIDQIERESSSEPEDLEEEEAPMDPMQGLVLLADQVLTEEANNSTADSPDAAGPAGGGAAARDGRSRSVSPSPTRGHGTPLSSKPSVVMSPSPPQQIAPPPPSRPAASPPRSRKSLGTAGSVGQGQLGLPGSAASALGYAS